MREKHCSTQILYAVERKPVPTGVLNPEEFFWGDILIFFSRMIGFYYRVPGFCDKTKIRVNNNFTILDLKKEIGNSYPIVKERRARLNGKALNDEVRLNTLVIRTSSIINF